ncbi:PrgI family protein [Candidatus Saccharibacteria bacterium]|nr:PrgI family protein [Candidatus Saccharibacteria bacterium]
MAQYKVPQDVEAEDKLLGPFTFRQFVYLLVAGGLVALAVGLFQLFPLLAIIPVLPAFLFLILALPLKKDQPMETYLAALVSYYIKPRTRKWTPGQRESTILITAPKIVEEVRKRDISEEEATHRLSFLADIVDTGGYAIKGAVNNSMREDLLAEANATVDMFDQYSSPNLNQAVAQDAEERRAAAIRGMREVLAQNETALMSNVMAEKAGRVKGEKVLARPGEEAKKAEVTKVAGVQSEPPAEPKESVIVMPDIDFMKNGGKGVQKSPKPSIIELASNTDFSVATIAKEANRLNRKDESEVFITLR